MDIADLFGKASIDTNYAIATTVDATRTAGVTVLDCVDVSKFPDDTPVFFVTYKKTTDPLTSEVTVTNLVSWKGLVNAGANTITNLTVAPGYTDEGNDEGDFVECIPTSYWGNSLVDGLLTSLNPDGTMKETAIYSGIETNGVKGADRYYTANDTWTKPANLKYVIVEVQAGGGGGGGAATASAGQSAFGRGGGGGGYSLKRILAADLASTVAVTVGAGGNGGAAGANNGSAGGSSSFGAHATATGGGAGGGGTSGTGVGSGGGGAGGTGASGDINNTGGSSGRGGRYVATGSLAPPGGNSKLGVGGAIMAALGASDANAGVNGSGYGGGGGGAATSDGGTAKAGGDGSLGIVIVHEYF